MIGRINFLKHTELFTGVSEPALAQILSGMQEIRLRGGETVFKKGDVGDAVYVVLEGKLRLDSDGVHLIFRAEGECVGEFALIDDAPRSASAVADGDVCLLRWGRVQFQVALVENPEVARGIFRILTAKLRQDIAIHVDYAIEKERWRQDLQRAREIQMGMLPVNDIKTERLTASGFCQPAVEVGGDYYDYLLHGDDKLGLMVADVTGHGFYSGLFVAMAKSCLHTLAEFDTRPARVMQAMRQTLSLSIQRRMLMSCCYAVIDPGGNELVYSNAGHPYPYHYRGTAKVLEKLSALDPILGALGLESTHFQEQSVTWNDGDVLVMYSDGITEERDANGRMFGHERLEQVIVDNAAEPSVTIKEAILKAVSTHGADVPQGDDLTLVVVKAQ